MHGPRTYPQSIEGFNLDLRLSRRGGNRVDVEALPSQSSPPRPVVVLQSTQGQEGDQGACEVPGESRGVSKFSCVVGSIARPR